MGFNNNPRGVPFLGIPLDYKKERKVIAMMTLLADTGVVSASDWSSVMTALTSQISVSTIVGVLATLVTAGIGLVFMWWGVRKALRSLMSAFRKGKMSL